MAKNQQQKLIDTIQLVNLEASAVQNYSSQLQKREKNKRHVKLNAVIISQCYRFSCQYTTSTWFIFGLI